MRKENELRVIFLQNVNVFRRLEEKYLINSAQYDNLIEVMSRHMIPDQYGDYLVQNIYYDTPHWDVIRNSVDRPLYKEKMRLRCYNRLETPQIPNDVFLELKKKYNGIVYKRRITMDKETPLNTMRDVVSRVDTQIARELDYYLNQNPVYERVHIAYRREALAGVENPDLRVTFDTQMRFRLDNLNFVSPLDSGRTILPQGEIVLEIKTIGGLPIWLTRALSESKVYPRTFSKYGTCYTNYIVHEEKGPVKHIA